VRRGFTLIEVMIALFILVLIGTTVSKAVLDAAKLKEVLKDETDFSSEFRTSTSFIERDLSQIFNPRSFLPPDFKPLDPYGPPPAPPAPGAQGTKVIPALSVDEINRKTRGSGFQSTDFWGPILDPNGIRASRFIGKEMEMSFVSASHVRIYQMKKESIYSKIRYQLIKQEPDPDRSKEANDKAVGLYSLIKIENPRAFEFDEPKDAPYVSRYVILSNVKKFKLSYFKGDSKDPLRDWDSEGSETKGLMPTAVEMEATLIGPKDRVLETKVLFNLETAQDVLPKTY